MKQFFKFMFASMLGVFLSLILFFFLFVMIIGGIVTSASSKKEISVESNSILQISFDQPIRERTSNNPFENMDFFSLESKSQPGLNDIVKNIEKASADPSIKGIFLDVSFLDGGMATIEEIRNALIQFKNSGKFILSYSDYYTQGSYYLASVGDEVWVNPEGGMDFNGFTSKLPFLKGTLEKLEVQPHVIRHGKFKSAVEPFILDKMSDENKEQVATYVNSFWNHFIKNVASSRKLNPDSLMNIADNMMIENPEDAIKFKMVDKIGYRDEFYTFLKQKTATNDDDNLNFISLKKYTKAPDVGNKKEYTRDKIAIIYATGDIISGEGSSEQIGSDELSETIRKARKDDKIKGVVLRVNSPGGSALASEVIWREVDLCRKEKPVIVSMGNVAASGGYYISCAADKILVQPNTITGSIGVIGLLFNAENMFKNKLGITFDSYSTGKYSDMGSMTRPVKEQEKQILQRSVERVYATFTKRVADGRKMEVHMVDSVGQGRVWSGEDAVELGLADAIGGMMDAVKLAAEQSKLTNFRIVELPEQDEPLAKIVKELQEDVYTSFLKFKFGDSYRVLEAVKLLEDYQGIQARSFIGELEF